MSNNITATLKLSIGHGVVGTFYRRDDNSIIIHIADNMEAAHGEGTTKHAEKNTFVLETVSNHPY